MGNTGVRGIASTVTSLKAVELCFFHRILGCPDTLEV